METLVRCSIGGDSGLIVKKIFIREGRVVHRLAEAQAKENTTHDYRYS